VGLRVPCYELANQRRSYWNWFETAVQPLFAWPAVIIGDFNCDPRRLKGHGPEHLARLAEAGWQLPDPAGHVSYSYRGKSSRIDHALASPAVSVRSADYIDSANGYVFMNPDSGFLSDHAALILDIVLPNVDPGIAMHPRQ
jgi:endonuclease/exonuclease/phosphatase family metal-dependent hydrolase